MKYEFQQTVMVDGLTHAIGEVIHAEKLPAGTLKSLLYVRALAPVSEAKPTPAPVEPAKSAAKKSYDTGPVKATGAA